MKKLFAGDRICLAPWAATLLLSIIFYLIEQ